MVETGKPNPWVTIHVTSQGSAKTPRETDTVRILKVQWGIPESVDLHTVECVEREKCVRRKWIRMWCTMNNGQGRGWRIYVHE